MHDESIPLRRDFFLSGFGRRFESAIWAGQPVCRAQETDGINQLGLAGSVLIPADHHLEEPTPCQVPWPTTGIEPIAVAARSTPHR
jgi:hypothetical protein